MRSTGPPATHRRHSRTLSTSTFSPTEEFRRVIEHITSGAGALLLAYLPESEQRELLAELRLTKQGPNTIASKAELSGELGAIRAEGLAVNDEELAPELHSIAAPVRDEGREVVAAVGLAAHTSVVSLAELVDALSPHLIATADRVSARLGYRRDDE
jgi:IclR family pca regulon transcriptional regulator